MGSYIDGLTFFFHTIHAIEVILRGIYSQGKKQRSDVAGNRVISSIQKFKREDKIHFVVIIGPQTVRETQICGKIVFLLRNLQGIMYLEILVNAQNLQLCSNHHDMPLKEKVTVVAKKITNMSRQKQNNLNTNFLSHILY